jgi:hypothetical protein
LQQLIQFNNQSEQKRKIEDMTTLQLRKLIEPLPLKKLTLSPIIDGTLVVSTENGKVYVIGVGKKREVQDVDTKNTLLLYNRSRKIQEKIVELSKDELDQYEDGLAHPRRLERGGYLQNGPISVAIPPAWQFLDTFTINKFPKDEFNVKPTMERDDTLDPNRITAVRFTRLTGEGHCYVLLEPLGSARSHSE